MSTNVLKPEDYRKMFEIGSDNDLLRDLYENSVEIDYENPSKQIEELNEAGLAAYVTYARDGSVDAVAEITALGELLVEGEFTGPENFCNEMLERDKASVERYSSQ